MTHAMRLKQLALALIVAAGMAAAGTAQAIEINSETDAMTLANALVSGSGSGLTIVSASLSGQTYDDNGALIVSSGTYTNASGTYGIGPGVVLSSGDLIYFGDESNLEALHSMNYGVPASPDQTAMLNSVSGGMPDFPDLFWDVTQLDIKFATSTGGVAVWVTFGSEEYCALDEICDPGYNDAFGVFLDLPAIPPQENDDEGNPLPIFDTSSYNIAFYQGAAININHPGLADCLGTELDGVLPCDGPMLFAVTGLAPGEHTLTFIIADNTDEFGDSVAYISGLRAIPEPATLALLGIGLAGLATLHRRQA